MADEPFSSNAIRTRLIGEIAAERLRQVRAEGYTTLHDDEHVDGDLADAAACYALTPEQRNTVPVHGGPPVPRRWPWECAAWKPTPDDRKRELIKAGALILAELERLERADQAK